MVQCTADRVMLSEYMTQHWAKVGYRPESDFLNGVDEIPELEIQVGNDKKENLLLSENNLSKKYRSVIVKGFLPETSIDTVTEELFRSGLPTGHKVDDILKNEKTGILTVTNLEPEQCLEIMEQMHAKRFLWRKIYVTSVVPYSPTKPAALHSPKLPQSEDPKSPAPAEKIPELLVPILPQLKPLQKLVRSNSMTNIDDFQFGPVTPDIGGVAEKIASFQLQNKRKATGSPESDDPSKKEKKLNKKDIKNKSKSEKKAAATLVSPTKKL